MRAHVAEALRRVPRGERIMLALRYVEGLREREIAALLGMTDRHVTRLLRARLAALRPAALRAALRKAS